MPQDLIELVPTFFQIENVLSCWKKNFVKFHKWGRLNYLLALYITRPCLPFGICRI